LFPALAHGVGKSSTTSVSLQLLKPETFVEVHHLCIGGSEVHHQSQPEPLWGTTKSPDALERAGNYEPLTKAWKSERVSHGAAVFSAQAKRKSNHSERIE
jgi:hypothetical protein